MAAPERSALRGAVGCGAPLFIALALFFLVFFVVWVGGYWVHVRRCR